MTPAGTTVGPLFVKVIVYVVDPPTFTVAMPSVLVTARSAVFLTVLLSFTVLFAGVGSASVALTVAVFTYVPPGVAALTVTLTVITQAAAPDANAGRVHVTAFPTFPHVPVGDVTLVTVYCDGHGVRDDEVRRVRRAGVVHRERVDDRLPGVHRVGRVRLRDGQVRRRDDVVDVGGRHLRERVPQRVRVVDAGRVRDGAGDALVDRAGHAEHGGRAAVDPSGLR